MGQLIWNIGKTVAGIVLAATVVWLVAGLLSFGLYNLLLGTAWALSADAAHALGYVAVWFACTLTAIFLVNDRRSEFCGSTVSRIAKDCDRDGASATNSNDPVSP